MFDDRKFNDLNSKNENLNICVFFHIITNSQNKWFNVLACGIQ